MELLAGKAVWVGVIEVASERVEGVEEVADTLARGAMSTMSISSRAPIAAWRR